MFRRERDQINFEDDVWVDLPDQGPRSLQAILTEYDLRLKGLENATMRLESDVNPMRLIG